MKKIIGALIAIAVAASISFAAEAKPGARTAVGFSGQLVGLDVASFAVRSWITEKIGVEALFGFLYGMYEEDNKQYGLGGKFLYLLKEDSSTKFYGTGVIAARSFDYGTTTETFMTYGVGLGWEVFITGERNLSLCAEIGIGYDDAASSVGSLGFGLDALGVRYYF